MAKDPRGHRHRQIPSTLLHDMPRLLHSPGFVGSGGRYSAKDPFPRCARSDSMLLKSLSLCQQAREKASEFAVRSLNDCPFYEGMLKVESHGEQRVRQLLYAQVLQRSQNVAPLALLENMPICKKLHLAPRSWGARCDGGESSDFCIYGTHDKRAATHRPSGCQPIACSRTAWSRAAKTNATPRWWTHSTCLKPGAHPVALSFSPEVRLVVMLGVANHTDSAAGVARSS